MRDRYCDEMFGKHYSLLTDSQLQKVYNEMVRDTMQMNSTPEKVASKVQIARVRLLSLWYAIEYCRLHDMHENYKETNYKGEELRKFLRQMLDKNRIMALTHYTVNELCKRSANPKCHELLVEGGFKKRANKPERFYYDLMKPDEASYLIQRFEQIRNQKEMKAKPFAQNSADEYLQNTGQSLN